MPCRTDSPGRRKVGERYVFALVTLVDVPIAQSLLVGAGLCLSSWSKNVAWLERRSDVVDRSQSISVSTAEQP
jgi:hypothetical protein